MTELEDREEHGGDKAGAQARELFARTVVHSRPRLAFTAEDLVLGGRRRVRRRRLAAIVGSTASVAVVAVAATAFAGGGGRSGAAVVTPAASVTTAVTTSASPSPSPSRSTARSLTDDERTLAEKKLAAAVFAEMLGKLDPGMKHLTYTPAPHAQVAFTPNTGVCTEKTKVQDAYGFDAYWTVAGKDPFPRSQDATSPYVQVSIEVFAPGQNVDQFGTGVGWGPLTRTSLSDGSVVATRSAEDGHRVQSVRTMGNGQQILFFALDSAGFSGEKTAPTNPFPFTAAQLSGIVSAVSLPLPFADGFQPHATCGP